MQHVPFPVLRGSAVFPPGRGWYIAYAQTTPPKATEQVENPGPARSVSYGFPEDRLGRWERGGRAKKPGDRFAPWNG